MIDPMRFLSVCSGIGCADLAFQRLGWEAAAMSEIEAFPRAVLAHRFPGVPVHGDFTTIQGDTYGPVQLLVGGTPCQSFSVAGLRGGMADARGNLALEYLRLAERLRARWLVWENVPGVLSSNGGRDFGAFLGGMAELGYGFAYRVLDAQHFGVAQRRRRVFVVGYLGDWRRAAAVLLEPASLRGHPAPRREKGEIPASTLTRGSPAGGRTPGLSADDCDLLIARCRTAHPSRSDGETENFVAIRTANTSSNGHGFGDVAYTLDRGAGSGQAVAHTLRGEGFDASEDDTGRGTPLVPVAFGWQNSASQGDSVSEHFSPTLDKSKTPAVMTTAVRRLTPRECERLQGLPDDHTLIPYRGGMAADGPRYKSIGNGMAVPCLTWIGRRLEAVDRSLRQDQTTPSPSATGHMPLAQASGERAHALLGS